MNNQKLVVSVDYDKPKFEVIKNKFDNRFRTTFHENLAIINDTMAIIKDNQTLSETVIEYLEEMYEKLKT